jgi:hypothetical protein
VQVNTTAEDPCALVLPMIDAPGLSLAFARVARAVRMTLALQARLESQPLRGRPAPGGPGAATAGGPNSLAPRAAPNPEALEGRADHEGVENLHDADEGGRLALPANALIALICRDLGLAPQAAAAFQARWARASAIDADGDGATVTPLYDAMGAEEVEMPVPPLGPAFASAARALGGSGLGP